MFNLEEIKIIEIIQEYQISLFKNKIKCKKNQTESLAFSIAKTCSHVFMMESIKANFEYSVDYSLSKIREYEFAAFFGNGLNITGTHHALKDPRKFWSMFALLITQTQYPSLHLKQIHESVRILDRMKVPLSGRNYAAYCLLLTDLFWNKNRNFLLDMNITKSEVSLNDILNIFNSDITNLMNNLIEQHVDATNRTLKNGSKSVTVYRGFDVSKRDDVRKNRYKRNNDEAHKQDAGAGISYSYSKKVAHDFSTQKFGAPSFVLTNTIQDRVSHASFLLKNLNIKTDDFLDVSERTPYVAKFELDKKDILIDISEFLEEEVIAFPSNIKLIDYRAVTYS